VSQFPLKTYGLRNAVTISQKNDTTPYDKTCSVCVVIYHTETETENNEKELKNDKHSRSSLSRRSGVISSPQRQSWGRKWVYDRKDLWNR